MKRLVFLFSGLALLFSQGLAQALMVDPVQVTLDMPNQIVTAPTSGVTMVDFTGTVFVDSTYRMTSAHADAPFNSSQTNGLLTGSFSAAFLTFFSGGNGTYTGSIFEIDVPAGTPPDLYAFQQFSSNPAMFTVQADPVFVVANRPDSINGNVGFSDSANFSVLVSAPANGVPDSGSTLLLMSLGGVAGVGCARRRFVPAKSGAA